MAVGSGLSATFGIATEPTPGVPVAVTRFAEFDSETMALKKGIVQGAGLRGGGLVRRAQRRILVSRMASGGVNFDAMTNGFGLFLQHMLGSYTTTPTPATIFVTPTAPTETVTAPVDAEQGVN